jgi:hypothetical protein
MHDLIGQIGVGHPGVAGPETVAVFSLLGAAVVAVFVIIHFMRRQDERNTKSET